MKAGEEGLAFIPEEDRQNKAIQNAFMRRVENRRHDYFDQQEWDFYNSCLKEIETNPQNWLNFIESTRPDLRDALNRDKDTFIEDTKCELEIEISVLRYLKWKEQNPPYNPDTAKDALKLPEDEQWKVFLTADEKEYFSESYSFLSSMLDYYNQHLWEIRHTSPEEYVRKKKGECEADIQEYGQRLRRGDYIETKKYDPNSKASLEMHLEHAECDLKEINEDPVRWREKTLQTYESRQREQIYRAFLEDRPRMSRQTYQSSRRPGGSRRRSPA
jgi:hypothetical protein